MRLLYLNHNVRYGGTYYRAMPMAEQLAARGHDVSLLTTSPHRLVRPQWSVVNGVHLGEMPRLGQRHSGEGYGPMDNLLRFAHASIHCYDIVHMFDHKPSVTFPGFPARLRKARLVADWADWWGGKGGINDVPSRRFPVVGTFEAWWEQRSKLWADGVVAISQVLYQRAISIGCTPEHTVLIPSGAPVERTYYPRTTHARALLGIPATRRLVGFIGMGQGDLHIVMQALQEFPDIWLMIIGKTQEKTHQIALDYGVEERVWQTGFVPDDQVEIYLACADVMCLPMQNRAANRGRFPNKMLDYLAAGRPTVASPVGDIADLMHSHKVGLLADDAEFAEALESLLTQPALREELGSHARRVAETVYAWPHLTDRLEQFYARILSD